MNKMRRMYTQHLSALIVELLRHSQVGNQTNLQERGPNSTFLKPPKRGKNAIPRFFFSPSLTNTKEEKKTYKNPNKSLYTRKEVHATTYVVHQGHISYLSSRKNIQHVTKFWINSFIQCEKRIKNC